MATIKAEDATAEELIEIGDQMMQQGSTALARNAYRLAQLKAPQSLRASIWARRAIARYEPPLHANLIPIQRAIEREFPHADAFVSSNLAVWGKTNSFMDNHRLLELSWKHQHLLPLPNWEWNFQAALWAAGQTRNIEGDFVELGVFKGHTTLILAEYFEFSSWDRNWYLFDTFSGIPEDQLNAGWSARNASSYKGTYSFEEVSERFAHIPNVRVIQGRVPDIFTAICPDKIAFIHMDLNSAAAEIAALNYLYERITPGGVILFDDYCWMAAREQYEAEKLWFHEKGLVVLELPTGQGVFVKR